MQTSEFVDRVAQRMAGAGWEPGWLPLPGGTVLTGLHSEFRLTWAASKLNAFIFVAQFPQSPPNGVLTLDALLDDAIEYAMARKGALAGHQTGVGVICVAAGHHWSAAERSWIRPHKRRMGLLTLPVIADLATGEVLRSQKGFYGWLQHRYLASITDDLVAGALLPQAV